MRRALVLLLTVLVLAPGLLARAKADWGTVEKLKPGSKVLVLLWTGDEIQGHVKAINPTGMTLVTGSNWRPLQEIARNEIRRIVHLRGPNWPDPDRYVEGRIDWRRRGGDSWGD